jgi:hypothetical protein
VAQHLLQPHVAHGVVVVEKLVDDLVQHLGLLACAQAARSAAPARRIAAVLQTSS